MSEFEKSLDTQSSAVDDVSNNVEPKELSVDDANSSERIDDTPEKESNGSLRDYFVGGERPHLFCIGLISNRGFFDMRTASAVSCTSLHWPVVLRLALLYP